MIISNKKIVHPFPKKDCNLSSEKVGHSFKLCTQNLAFELISLCTNLKERPKPSICCDHLYMTSQTLFIINFFLLNSTWILQSRRRQIYSRRHDFTIRSVCLSVCQEKCRYLVIRQTPFF